MMDPMTAISIASSILQIVDFAAYYGNRIVQFSKAQVELPESLRQIQQRLGIVKDSLEQIAEHIKSNPDNYAQSSLNDLSGFTLGLKQRCDELDDILNHYLPVKDASKVEKISKAVLSIGKDKKVDAFASRMTSDVTYLILFQVTARSGNSGSNNVGRFSHLEGRFISNIPQRQVHGFIGQEELLKDISTYFAQDSKHEPSVLILQGMGGIGKTQAALEYSRQMKSDGIYSAIFWADASSKSTLQQSFEAIAEMIKPPTHIFPDRDHQIQYTISILTEWQKKWLLIMDNYDDPNLFNIKECFPASQKGNVMITSRSPELHRIGHVIEVQGMREQDAVELLFNRIGEELSDQNRQNGISIVSRLGYLPLAIDQTGAYIKERKETLSLNEFLPYYDNYMKEILTSTPNIWEYLDNSESNKDGLKNVFTTWNMSYALLVSSNESSKRDVGLLESFAFFDEKDISEEMFRKFFNDMDKTEWPPWFSEFGDGKSWSSKKFGDTIRRLKAFSLVSSFHQVDGFLHISIHPLVRDWIKLRQNEDSMKTNFAFAAKVLCCTLIQQFWRACDPDPLLPEDLEYIITESMRNAYLGHLFAWEKQFQFVRSTHHPAFMVPKHEVYPKTLSVELCMLLFFAGFGLPNISLSIIEWVWNSCEDDEPVSRFAKGRAGAIWVDILVRMQKVREAVRVARDAVQTWEKLLKPDDSVLLRAKNKYGVALDRLHMLEHGRREEILGEIEALCRDVLANSAHLKEVCRPNYDAYLFELGYILLETDNEEKQEEGRSIFKDLVRRGRSEPPQEAEWSLRVLDGLAMWSEDNEDQDYYSHLLLDISMSRSGLARSDLVQAVIARGIILFKVGKLEEAESIARDCIEWSKKLSEQNRSVMDSYELMGDINVAKKNYSDAATNFGEALRCLQSVQDENPVQSNHGMRVLGKLGTALRRAKRLEEAKGVWLWRLEICRNLGDVAHILDSLRFLGMTLCESNQASSALPYYTEAIQFFEEKPATQQSSIAGAEATPSDSEQRVDDDWKGLQQKKGANYGFLHVVDRAFAYARLRNFPLADADAKRAMRAFDSMSSIQTFAEPFFIEEVLVLSTWMTYEDLVPMKWAFEYTEWALHQAKQRLGDDHELVKRCLKELDVFERRKKKSEEKAVKAVRTTSIRRERETVTKTAGKKTKEASANVPDKPATESTRRRKRDSIFRLFSSRRVA